VAVSACGGSQANVQTSSGASSAPASTTPPPPQPPKEKPFASSPMQAQSMIQEQIDGQMTVLWKCVNDYRGRVKELHKEVLIDIGIDQEGILMGVTTATPKKGELEPMLKQCLYTSLHGLPFPRSHAGVISVRESFKDAAVYP
jgi:hypothetical protein